MSRIAGTKTELVCVIYEAEARFALLQARSIALHFAHDDISKIHLICNSPRFAAKSFVRHKIIPAFGPLASRVVVHQSHELIDIEDYSLSGWRSQQLMKMVISRQIETPTYIILDAKNHLIRKAGLADFVSKAGRLRIRKQPPLPYDKTRVFRNSAAVFDLVPELHLKRSIPNMTPFIVHTQTMRNMIDDIETRHEGKLESILTEKFPDTYEFYLYLAYLFKMDLYSSLYDVIPADNSIGMWPVTDRAGLSLYLAAVDENIKFFSVHRRRIPEMGEVEKDFVITMWMRCGLVGTEEEANEIFDCGDHFSE